MWEALWSPLQGSLLLVESKKKIVIMTWFWFQNNYQEVGHNHFHFLQVRKVAHISDTAADKLDFMKAIPTPQQHSPGDRVTAFSLLLFFRGQMLWSSVWEVVTPQFENH